MNWKKYKKYFTPEEFYSPDVNKEEMQESFIDLLFEARVKAKTPFKILSGYRTSHRNAMVGGVAESSHMNGCACDINIGNSGQRFKILNALICVGFNRIGVGKSFIHVDNDTSKIKNMVWTY